MAFPVGHIRSFSPSGIAVPICRLSPCVCLPICLLFRLGQQQLPTQMPSANPPVPGLGHPIPNHRFSPPVGPSSHLGSSGCPVQVCGSRLPHSPNRSLPPRLPCGQPMLLSYLSVSTIPDVTSAAPVSTTPSFLADIWWLYGR